ncbi:MULTISPECIES: FAD-dependent oxidoreductase [Anaerotruncus]|uniref:Pyridine nucleotide-disulfide oxidoreductase n=2 Tax=Anaerotruncus TaxID=244127 RepID=A0A498CK98_9FIRM|nr:FAD-dependent oxidoreductase [Anaerotruncus massiliensis (ex Liu et al. 2021)]MBC3939688.1 FAD-dependent oxidoreductase [Anaerotruncus massiliensis (ex Togo et al. 2019)]MCQ4894998.1 FAD-dependent oxidoreductase [Anaerotruncus sp. DFI.9.16]RLL08391.1 pyridine nucleotide-disulfide oxidoreductase [Anaerotruncus massiliensis (ex Liu et al. 2021)]
MKQYDAIVIGFGKGGKTLAGKLGASGKTVAMIEKSDRMYGGTCINVGCIPSKSLVRSSGISHGHRNADFEKKQAFYAAAIEEKRRLTAMLRKKNFDKLDGNPNVTVFNGMGSFLSPTQVQVVSDRGETLVLEGKQIFINTGSTPVVPPIEGLRENPFVYLSEGLMDLEKLPRRLAIIGGGYIGLEFASIYAGFGSQVTVFEGAPVFLPREDADIAAEIKKALEAKGVAFQIGAAVKKVADAGDHAEVTFARESAEETLAADAVLVATGRRPNTDGLNAAEAGVELTPRGAVKVDEKLRTTAPNIWAMGDVVGGLQFTYVSLDDFRIVWSQLSGGDYDAARRKNVPYSVFIDPSFSRVGLNEREAREAGRNVKVLTLPAAAIPKAQVLKHPVGLLKAVVDADTNKILGAMLFCEESYEMINIVKLAMDLDADYTVLGRQVFTHPTMSEALNDLFA